MLPHQRDIVIWAIKGGRRAIFAAFGLGKSIIQIEILRLILKHLGKGRALLVAPLGVRQEFARDGRLDTKAFRKRAAELGLDHAEIVARYGIEFQFVRQSHEVSGDGFYITNYEAVRDGALNPELFDVVSLDEASCLRSSGSKTYHKFLMLFARIRFRFCATATPSPNDFIEILNYAGFLGIMDKSYAKTRFFTRNAQKANDLRLAPNMREEWWSFVHSWAVFLQRPSDLGYPDEGYDLPPYEVVWHEIPSHHENARPERNGQGKLYSDSSASLPAAAAEKRESMSERIAKMLEIVKDSPSDHFVLWHDLEDERRAIQTALPECLSVWGNEESTERENRIVGFSEGRFQYLSTKPQIAGSGPNFQYFCHREIFCGIGYKFNDFIQAVHRIVRFQQSESCRIDCIYTEAERPIRDALLLKWKKHDETQEEMRLLILEFGLNQSKLQKSLMRRMNTDYREEIGRFFRMVNDDTVFETARMAFAGEMVDMILTSIPFGTQYEYGDKYNDFGHNDGNAAFWKQMSFLTTNLFKILKPGRIAAIHVKDRVSFGAYTGLGFPTIEPFHADAIAHFRSHGFAFMGMITVDTDVVKENNGTYRLGWTECCKDGTKMGVGSPEYVLIFRKQPTDLSDGYADAPVVKQKRRWDFGTRIELPSMSAMVVPDSSHDAAHSDDDIDDDEFGDEDEDLGDALLAEDPQYLMTPAGWNNEEGYSRARWQLDAHAHWKTSGARLLTLDEIEDLHPTAIPRAWAVYDQESPYNYWDHVCLAEKLETRKKLSSNFMMVPPMSTLAEQDRIWSDVVRQLTLNGNQTAKGLNNHICPLQFDIVDRLIFRYSSPGDTIYDPFMGIGTVGYRAIKFGRKAIGCELNAGYFEDSLRYLRQAETTSLTPSLFDFEEVQVDQPGPVAIMAAATEADIAAQEMHQDPGLVDAVLAVESEGGISTSDTTEDTTEPAEDIKPAPVMVPSANAVDASVLNMPFLPSKLAVVTSPDVFAGLTYVAPGPEPKLIQGPDDSIPGAPMLRAQSALDVCMANLGMALKAAGFDCSAHWDAGRRIDDEVIRTKNQILGRPHSARPIGDVDDWKAAIDRVPEFVALWKVTQSPAQAALEGGQL